MIHSKLEETRRALLDLTRRNRLLNFRPDAANVVRVCGESPAHVYRLLAEAQKTLRLVAAEEGELPPAPGSGASSATDPRAPTGCPGAAIDSPPTITSGAPSALADTQHAQHTEPPATWGDGLLSAERLEDDLLQTPHRAEDLDRRLLNLAREAESALQEQGCNILFLAIGLVEWTDRLDSKVRSLAPVVLLPVELIRRSVRRRHTLRMLDEESVLNPVFQELCRTQLGLRLPDFDPDAADPLGACLAAVANAIRPLRSWTLRADINLALLSFSKLLMYLDLDDSRWGHGEKVSQHPQVLGLTGLGAAWPRPAPPPDPAELDDRVAPQETFQVLDADSSQAAAIVAAKGGASLVIQGPPGTGKSQTITNIIAECLSQGRTVLFVAEKAAALDVVHRRLTQVGLGAFTAALHSRKASKRAFMEDLKRSLALDWRPLHARQRLNPEDLGRLRADLNLYVRALHRPLLPLGLTPYEAIGRSLALAAAPEAPIILNDPLRWDPARLRRAEEAIAAYAAATRKAGDPSTHPWRGVGIDSLPLAKRQQVDRAVRAVAQAINALQSAAARAGLVLGSPAATTVADTAVLAAAMASALRAPAITPGSLGGQTWDATRAELPMLLAAGRRLDEVRESLAERWTPQAQDANWSAAAACYKQQGASVLRWVSLAWWKARGQVRRHTVPQTTHPGNARLTADLVLLLEADRLRHEIARASTWAEPLFGSLWKSDASDWDRLNLYAEAAVALRAAIRRGLATEAGVAVFSDPLRREQAAAITEELRRAHARYVSDLQDLVALLVIDLPAFVGGDPERRAMTSLAARVRECESASESLVDWTERTRARAACSSAGLSSFLEWVDAAAGRAADRGMALSVDFMPAAASQSTPIAPSHGRWRGIPTESWTDAFRRQFYRLWADAAIAECAPLSGFRAEEHERAIGVFRQLDAQWLEDTRRRLVAGVGAARPRVGSSLTENSGLGILEAQLRRQRNIMSIRRLLASPAGEAVLRIKPCFMMSPLSVAQHLEPGRLKFDVVIFDEASQVEPADALGAVARGKQLILVGDEKQLPPTSFFTAMTADAGAGGVEGEFDIPVGDLESVLSLGAASLPRTTLRWHYRSRHQSLIDFSNREFYDSLLRVFPSPCAERGDQGLSTVYVEGGVYLRGHGQSNPVEARRVAEAVMEHARERPGQSLGVGAFSVAQQRAIEDELESLRRVAEAPSVEEFFDPARDEPFFVKNLETVQGDERDVMLLSVGYGPDQHGRVTMNFGPLNQDGGWRRLNVLVTRARHRCILFTSLRPDQIRAEADTPRGVRALKAYLAYAAGGAALSPAQAATGRPAPLKSESETADSTRLASFEQVVADCLRGAGWAVHEAVGCAGFAIDLAVVDPANPERYLAGVECDGPGYHSLPTARDRDRLRTQVLESLGWTILRVWAPDWFQRPERSLRTLIEQLHAAATEHEPGVRDAEAVLPEEDSSSAESDDGAEVEAGDAEALPEGVVPYVRYKLRRKGDRERLLRTRAGALAEVVKEIVAVEGPIHRDEATRVAAALYDCRPVGQAAERIREAIEAATALKAIRSVGEFLWPAAMDRPPLRWRGAAGAVTAAELICVEEMVEAVAWVATHEFGVPLDDLPAAAIRRLGFKRSGRSLEALARAGVEAARKAQRITAGADGFARAGP